MTLDELATIERELLGRGGVFPTFRARVATLATAGEKRAVGREINEATRRLSEAITARRAELSRDARVAQLEAERLDLTEVITRPPHLFPRLR